MNTAPRKVTILADWRGNSFTILAETLTREIEVCEELAFDEMLGLLSRLFVPTMDDGTVNRKCGRPLFLTLPTKSPSQEPKG